MEMRSRPATRRVPRAKSVRRWRWTLSRSRQSSTNPGLRKARCGRLRLPTRSPQGSYPRRSYHARIRDRCRCSGCESNNIELHFGFARAGRIVLHERDEGVTEAAAADDRIDAERAKPRCPLIECPSPNRADNDPIDKRDGRLGGIWKPLRRLHRSGRSSSGTVRSPRAHTPGSQRRLRQTRGPYPRRRQARAIGQLAPPEGTALLAVRVFMNVTRTSHARSSI
jgi:hypothetical protein